MIHGASRSRRGSYLERRTIAWLAELGYTAFRSAGSHGPFDLYAFSHSRILLVQVKGSKWPSSSELDIIAALPVPQSPAIIKLILRWRRFRSMPDPRYWSPYTKSWEFAWPPGLKTQLLASPPRLQHHPGQERQHGEHQDGHPDHNGQDAAEPEKAP